MFVFILFLIVLLDLYEDILPSTDDEYAEVVRQFNHLTTKERIEQGIKDKYDFILLSFLSTLYIISYYILIK